MPNEEIKKPSVEIATSMVNAYYSSGACNGMSFFDFTLQYLECLKSGIDAVDNFLDDLSKNNGRGK